MRVFCLFSWLPHPLISDHSRERYQPLPSGARNPVRALADMNNNNNSYRGGVRTRSQSRQPFGSHFFLHAWLIIRLGISYCSFSTRESVRDFSVEGDFIFNFSPPTGSWHFISSLRFFFLMWQCCCCCCPHQGRFAFIPTDHKPTDRPQTYQPHVRTGNSPFVLYFSFFFLLKFLLFFFFFSLFFICFFFLAVSYFCSFLFLILFFLFSSFVPFLLNNFLVPVCSVCLASTKKLLFFLGKIISTELEKMIMVGLMNT